MAKELPYFKFVSNDWDSGNIQGCSFEAKGLFIDICSLYWSRLGKLKIKLAKQKLFISNANAYQELVNEGIIKEVDELIMIEFLDEQLVEFEDTSNKRRDAAMKRWSNANAMQMHSKSNAIREDKIKEDKIRENNIIKRENEFRLQLKNFSNEFEISLLNDFANYWTEPNKSKTKMRFEMQKTWDLKRRLKTWEKNNYKNYGAQKTNTTSTAGKSLVEIQFGKTKNNEYGNVQYGGNSQDQNQISGHEHL